MSKPTTTTTSPLPQVVDAEGAAKFLSLDVKTLKWFTKTRQIPFFRVGGRLIRYDLNRLAAWVSEREGVELQYNKSTSKK